MRHFLLFSVLVIVAMGTSACGRKNKLELGEFAAYVERFEQESVNHGSPVEVTDLVIKRGDMGNPQERGLCEVYEDETPLITIDGAHWDLMNDLERESLIFHELGHCVLMRAHNDATDSSGLPNSIMNRYMLSYSDYNSRHGSLVNELFHP